MTSKEIRQKYLNFFESRGHKVIPAAPLVLENDPTTLFTSAGMQPLVPYLKGEQKHPEGTRLVDSQPSFRAEDIEEVGDNRHTTCFEMLGNWSLGEYFKKEQLSWFWEFLTEELKLEKDRLHVSVFEGADDVEKDNESYGIWKDLGVEESHIHWYGAKKNWWSRSGPPAQMAVGDIGGPDSEVFYDFGEDLKFHETSQFKDQECHPNCDCGRFIEIGNSVFIQYKKSEDGNLQELPAKNVDFGGGLERTTAAKNNLPDIFQTDIYLPIVHSIEVATNKKYEGGDRVAMRIIADHIKAATLMMICGVLPANKMQGYVLRRLLRRAAVKFQQLTGELDTSAFGEISKSVLEIYDGINGVDAKNQEVLVSEVIKEEMERFAKTLNRGLKEIDKLTTIDGQIAFDLYQTYGFPLELTEELATLKGLGVDREQFYQEFEKHKELSRTASAGMFKGGLASMGETETKYHTATHLLHAALRQVLGDHVIQRGSNITSERLRFDFSHNEKLTDEQLKEVENLINEKIQENLPVTFQEMDKEEAEKTGAIHAFGEKYGDRVKVYTIGDPSASSGPPFSREFCGGPHVSNTGEIGRVTITKEESAGSGIRRIYASLSNPVTQ